MNSHELDVMAEPPHRRPHGRTPSYRSSLNSSFHPFPSYRRTRIPLINVIEDRLSYDGTPLDALLLQELSEREVEAALVNLEQELNRGNGTVNHIHRNLSTLVVELAFAVIRRVRVSKEQCN